MCNPQAAIHTELGLSTFMQLKKDGEFNTAVSQLV